MGAGPLPAVAGCKPGRGRVRHLSEIARRVPALCVCGLAAEARIARRSGFAAVVGAGHPERLAALVEAALPQARYLVSFGIAGALAAQLRPGDTILSGEIIAEEQRWQGAEAWRRRLAELAREIGAVEGPVFGARGILATSADKAGCRERSGAVAVDLESAVVARLAAAADIPFVILRAIADPLARSLPPAALIPLRADGKPDLPRVLMSVLRRPGQIPALLSLAGEARTALAALERPARALRGLLAAL